jgi:arylsulfatase
VPESISRRGFLRRSAAGTVATAVGGRPVSSPASRPDRPNILFIMTDEHRWDCLGANGNRWIQTPNLDRLAARSANFETAVVQAPVCTPSRASFWTGRYPHAHRNRVNYTELKSDEVLMQARLKEAGYATCIVGKSHVYHRYPPSSEQARRDGFDIAEIHDGVGFTDKWSAYAQWRSQHDPLAKHHYRRTARDVTGVAHGENPFRSAIEQQYTDTAWTGMRTRHHLQELSARQGPWFLFSSFWKPHPPFEVPVPFDDMYNDVELPLPKRTTLDEIRRLPLPLQKLVLRHKKPPYDTPGEILQWFYRSYYASISHIDQEVGLILDTLENSGQKDNTIVIFASDHGSQMLEHGIMGKNCFFEASVRVPFLISLPGRIQPGRYEQMIEAVDVLPTVFEMISLPEPLACQGRSFASLLTGQSASYLEREAVFCENIIPEVITSSLDFPFEKGRGVGGIRHPDAKMVRTRRYKYCYYPEHGAELYDLLNDPGEEVNLANDAAYHRIALEMRSRLLDWLITAAEVDQIAPRWLIP